MFGESLMSTHSILSMAAKHCGRGEQRSTHFLAGCQQKDHWLWSRKPNMMNIDEWRVRDLRDELSLNCSTFSLLSTSRFSRYSNGSCLSNELARDVWSIL